MSRHENRDRVISAKSAEEFDLMLQRAHGGKKLLPSDNLRPSALFPPARQPVRKSAASILADLESSIRRIEAFDDVELIQSVLRVVYPRRNIDAILADILSRFGSYARAISAPVAELQKVQGLGRPAITAMKILHVTALRLNNPKSRDYSAPAERKKIISYLQSVLMFKSVQSVHLIYLNSTFRIVKDETICSGTIDVVMIYPRVILEKCINCRASYVIMAHNHPEGDSDPSIEDKDSTLATARALDLFSIGLLDHFVFGGDGSICSMRESGMLNFPLAAKVQRYPFGAYYL